MIRTCSKADWERNYISEMMKEFTGNQEPCGRVYEDAERSTICPHEELTGVVEHYGPDNNYGYPKENDNGTSDKRTNLQRPE